MPDKLPTAIWQGEFTLLGKRLRVFTLDDGRRIIDADDTNDFLAAMTITGNAGFTRADLAELERMRAWQQGEDKEP